MPSSLSAFRCRSARLVVVLLTGLLAGWLPPLAALADSSSEAPGRVAGLVFDQFNRRLADATIELTTSSGTIAGTTKTDGAGHWSISVPQGEYDVAVAAPVDGEPLVANVRGYPVGADSRLNLVVAGGHIEPARLSGVVLDGNQHPLPGVRVALGTSGYDERWTATTGPDGRFALSNDPGRYNLLVTVPAANGLSGVTTITVWDFVLLADRDLTMTIPMVAVDVLVNDTQGRPVAGATVSAGSEACGHCPDGFELFPGATYTSTAGGSQGQTGTDGRAHLVVLDAGKLVVFTHTDSTNMTRTDTTVAQAHPLAVTLRPPAPVTPTPTGPSVTLTGRLLDTDGAPFTPEGTQISLQSAISGASGGIQDDGSFSLTAPSGIWSLVLEIGVKDYECCDERPPEHALRFTVNNFVLDGDRHQDLRLPRMAFPVTVVDPDGAPVAGAWVRAQTPDGALPVLHDGLFPGADATVWAFVDQPTDASGVAHMGLVPGALPPSISVDPPGGRGLPATAPLVAGTTKANVRLSDGPTLRGRFLGTGANHGSLVGADGRQIKFTLNGDGTYAVTAPAGRYRLLLDNWYPQEGESNDFDSWSIASEPFRLSGDRTLDFDYHIAYGTMWAVDSTGVRLDSLGGYGGGSLIGHQPIASGLPATAHFSVGGPGDYNSFGFALLGPSLAWCRIGGDDTLALNTGVYVAPGEDTIVAYAAGYGPETQTEEPKPPPPSPTTTVTTNPNPAEPGATTATAPGPSNAGYWALSSDGTVYNFGDAPHLGNSPVGAVDLEPTPSGKGYWTLTKSGSVRAFGDATALGNVDTAKLAPDEALASLSATPTGRGYWVFTNKGRAIAFGDAHHLGDMSQVKLHGPVLGSVATPSGKGYYMVASDGGIFAFGDAAFAGSMGGKKLNAPVQSLVPDADGKGYWLVASDGGIFAFDAPFRGSMGGTKLNKPVVGMVRYGDGYLMVGADGGIFNFSSHTFSGSLGDKPPASPVVAVAALA